jgi:hypothetical protein
MVKRREPTATQRKPTTAEIEAFAAGADGGQTTAPALDPNANRDYKAIRVPFNEYEFSKLEELASKTGRTKLNVIRWAMLKLSEEVQKGS